MKKTAMDMWTVRTWRPALVLAAGVAGTAALATVSVSARTTSGAQQPLLVAGSGSVAAAPAASATQIRAVPPSGRARATLTLPQVQAIAEKSARGRAEAVDLIDPARLSYQVSLSRPDGAETEVVVDGRTGQVLSKVVEVQDRAEPEDRVGPQDRAVPRDPGQAQDRAVTRDPGQAQDRAVPRDPGQPHDLVEPQDPAEDGN